MSKTYTLLCNGQRYDGVTLDEAKRILIVGGYSYHYVDQLARDTLPTIEEADGEVAAWLRYANELCERAEVRIKEIRDLCDDLDNEFRRWVLSKKSTLAQKSDTVAESPKPSLRKGSTAPDNRRAKQP